MIDVDLLKMDTLIDMINEFQPVNLRLTPSGILPPQSAAGQEFSWDILGIERDIGKFEGKVSPAGVRKLQVIKQQSARLARTFKSTAVPGTVLIDLRNPGSEQRQRVAQDQIGRELMALTRLIDRQNEFMIASALQGSLAITIDELSHTIDYGFSASHLPTPGGATIPLAWDDPAADITGALDRIINLIEEDAGFTPTTVWTSREVISALIRNDFVQSYFASTPAGVQALTEGTIGRFHGLNWIAFNGTFKPEGGSATRYIPKEQAIFTPDPDPEWGFMRVGSDVIPNDDKRSMQEVIGRYSYSTLVENPASIGLFAGEVRLPIIRIPDAIVNAQVLN